MCHTNQRGHRRYDLQDAPKITKGHPIAAALCIEITVEDITAIPNSDKFLAAANSADKKLGLTPDERGQAAVRRLIKGWVTA